MDDSLEEKEMKSFLRITPLSNRAVICPYCDGWKPPYTLVHICADGNGNYTNTFLRGFCRYLEIRNVNSNKILFLCKFNEDSGLWEEIKEAK